MTYKEAYYELLETMLKWQEDDREARRKVSSKHSLGQDYSLSRCVNKAKQLLDQINER